MSAINLVDPSLKNYENIVLSIQADLDGFSFCIRSEEDDRVHAFRHYKFGHSTLQEEILNQSQDILQKDDLLRLHFRKVNLCFFSRKSTIVPASYSEISGYKKILEFNQPIDDFDEIHYNSLPACDANLIFTIPSYFAGMVASKFSNICYINQATPLILQSLKMAGHEPTFISLQLNREFFDLVILQDGQLKLYNTFLYSNATDLLYFILYSCKQLGLDIKHTPILPTGEHSGDESLIRDLKPYLSSRKIHSATSEHNLAPALKKLDTGRFFTLLNLHSCES
ncbi:MAG: DUF3822 family protein [Bacteroidales bacterium]|nr:DUF3822 family protein [Bacteroidales bacterium]